MNKISMHPDEDGCAIGIYQGKEEIYRLVEMPHTYSIVCVSTGYEVYSSHHYVEALRMMIRTYENRCLQLGATVIV